MEIDLEQIRELMRSVNEFDIGELEIRTGDSKLVLRRGLIAPPLAVAAAPALATTPAPRAAPDGEAPVAASEEGVVYVTSPFVGTFYRSPSPESPFFVKEGDAIEPGRVLCIVEAMKLMNEIEAELRGTILEILVENGMPVEYGDPLFKIAAS